MTMIKQNKAEKQLLKGINSIKHLYNKIIQFKVYGKKQAEVF